MRFEIVMTLCDIRGDNIVCIRVPKWGSAMLLGWTMTHFEVRGGSGAGSECAAGWVRGWRESAYRVDVRALCTKGTRIPACSSQTEYGTADENQHQRYVRVE